MHNREKTYSGFKNQRRYWGEAVNGGAVLGDCNCMIMMGSDTGYIVRSGIGSARLDSTQHKLVTYL